MDATSVRLTNQLSVLFGEVPKITKAENCPGSWYVWTILQSLEAPVGQIFTYLGLAEGCFYTWSLTVQANCHPQGHLTSTYIQLMVLVK
jgi:hypothetical protein